MLLRFMFTVEFIDWKMSPEPSSSVSGRCTSIRSVSITGFDDESLPKMTPTSLWSRYSSSMPACSKASLEAMKA